MFSHVMIGTNDLEKSKKFYDALFKALGGREAIVDPKGRLIYIHNGGTFLVTPPIDGQPACHANGGTIGFAADSPEQADAWHAAGVAAGGKAIEDPPGWREGNGMRHAARLVIDDGLESSLEGQLPVRRRADENLRAAHGHNGLPLPRLPETDERALFAVDVPAR